MNYATGAVLFNRPSAVLFERRSQEDDDFPVDEPDVNLDLNGDGDMMDLGVPTRSFILRQNPTIGAVDIKRDPTSITDY